MQLDLKNKVVVVTVASRGIGREAAVRLAESGARVVVNYYKSQSEAMSVVREIGENATPIQADVADPLQVAFLMEETESKLGRVDVLVNNAATFDINPF